MHLLHHRRRPLLPAVHVGDAVLPQQRHQFVVERLGRLGIGRRSGRVLRPLLLGGRVVDLNTDSLLNLAVF